MNRSTRPNLLFVLFMATLGAFGQETRSDDSTADGAFSCGTFALFNMIRLSGQGCSLDEVSAVLPGRDPRGHSLEELRDGADRLGVDLEGIQLRHADVSPDRPMIVFVEKQGHGHFVAIRPVGHTGRLVQVFDGLAAPEVMDMFDLVRKPGWTGLGLISSKSRWTIRASTLLVTLAIMTGLGGIVAIAISKRRQTKGYPR
jgi:hypothetical protein